MDLFSIFPPMKPFLLLQHRYLDEASDNEYEAVLTYSGLQPQQMFRVRMEQQSIAGLSLADFSGVITGGGPANVSDAEEIKRPEQLRFEQELELMYEEIFEKDFPYLGMCYGMGSITRFLGGQVSKEKFGEPVGAVTISLNKNENDPILAGIPDSFTAFAGHKEACQQLPEKAILLASSPDCPVQMLRCKNNIYATQFHPELDAKGIVVRIICYRNHGYFKPEEADTLIRQVQRDEVIYPQRILRNFIERYLK